MGIIAGKLLSTDMGVTNIGQAPSLSRFGDGD